MPQGRLKVLNWNIAGAKYLELRSKDSPTAPRPELEATREVFRQRLNETLRSLIARHQPDVITLQEVARYDTDGRDRQARHVIDPPSEYEYFPYWLIDTLHHSATGKWDKVRRMGEWSPNAFFAQGNATLLKKGIPYFRPFDLPAVNTPPDPAQRERIEVVKLESGLYLGDRNTEPRAALVTHLVLSQLHNGKSIEHLGRPIDIFVINLHLTTLTNEREGIPEIDADAAQTRLRQLDIVMNGIVSRYNKWRKDKFRIRGEKSDPREGETHERHSPIWIIAGDFNFTPESTEYAAMVQRGFIDLIRNHDLGTKTSGLGESPTLTVDYVFAGPRFDAIDPVVARDEGVQNHIEVTRQTRVSDHFPLIVDVPIYVEKP